MNQRRAVGIPRGADAKTRDHLFPKLEALLDEERRGLEQDVDIVVAVLNTVLVEIEGQVTTFFVVVPRRFGGHGFGIVTAVDVTTQGCRLSS